MAVATVVVVGKHLIDRRWQSPRSIVLDLAIVRNIVTVGIPS
jgi:hypothetical protein